MRINQFVPQQFQRRILGPVDAALLQAVARFHYLTARQMTRLLYAPGSFTYVSTRVKQLTDGGYLQRLFLPRTTRYGNAPSVYTLARKGQQFLRDAGHDTPPRARPSGEREHSYLFFAHTLAINDVLIGLELLCRTDSAVTARRIIHERVLKRTPLYVQDEDGTHLAVIPDAYIDLAIADQYQVCLSLELDRGTEEQKAWKRKVRALVSYAEGPYIETFGTDALTVAVVATPGMPRLMNLKRWTEEELSRRGQERNADLFRFAAFDPAVTEPHDIFLAPRWFVPFQDQAVALLPTV